MNSGVSPGAEDERASLLIEWKEGDIDFADAFDLSRRIPEVFSIGLYDDFCVVVVYRSGLADSNTTERIKRVNFRNLVRKRY